MLPMWYVSARRDVEAFFKPENKDREKLKHVSPCKEYKLTVFSYQAVKNGSNYTRGIVTKRSDRTTIADVKRSDEDFWFCWLPKNKKLLCGEDPYGYSVINLKTSETTVYVDPKARSGMAFEWKEAKANPSETLLAVSGKYMGVIKTVLIYKVQDIPMPVVKSLDARLLGEKFKIRWQNNEVLNVKMPKKTINVKVKNDPKAS